MEVADLEYYYLAKEMNEKLSGCRIKKVFQISENAFKINVAGANGKHEMLIKLPEYATLTSREIAAPKTPSNFSMLLRKQLSNGIIACVKQHDFERIIEIEVGAGEMMRKLILELFSKGNIIICNDKEIITALYRKEEWKSRVIRKGIKYEYPPAKISPFDAKPEHLGLNSKNTIMAGVLSQVSLGPKYLEEAFARVGINPAMKVELSDNEKQCLHQAILEVCSEGTFIMYLKDGAPTDYAVCNLSKYKNYEHKIFDSAAELIDAFYSPAETSASDETSEKKDEIIAHQFAERLNALKFEAQLSRAKGDCIYEHFSEIEELVEEIRALRKKGMNDTEINKLIDKKFPGMRAIIKGNTLKIKMKARE